MDAHALKLAFDDRSKTTSVHDSVGILCRMFPVVVQS